LNSDKKIKNESYGVGDFFKNFIDDINRLNTTTEFLIGAGIALLISLFGNFLIFIAVIFGTIFMFHAFLKEGRKGTKKTLENQKSEEHKS